jgi:2'-5' RNA ligase
VSETAVVVLVPELEPLIGEWRHRHTADGARGMPPHVTLIYPFADTPDVRDRVAAVERELGRFASFEVDFRGTGRFIDTLYLTPEPADPFVGMTEALLRAIPEFPPYGGEFDEIVPHLTVAHGDDRLLALIEGELSSRLPLTARVERAWLMEDTAKGWRRHTPFPLR